MLASETLDVSKSSHSQVKSAVLEEEEAPIPEQPALFLPAASPALLIEKSDYHDFLAELGTRSLPHGTFAEI